MINGVAVIDCQSRTHSGDVVKAGCASCNDATDRWRGCVLNDEDEGHCFGMESIGHGEGKASSRNDHVVLEVSANHAHQCDAVGIFPVGAVECALGIPGVISALVSYFNDRGAILAVQSAEVAGQVVQSARVVVDICISRGIGVGRVYKREGANIVVYRVVHISWSGFNFIVQRVVNIDHKGHIGRIQAIRYGHGRGRGDLVDQISHNHAHQRYVIFVFPVGADQRAVDIPGIDDTVVSNAFNG